MEALNQGTATMSINANTPDVHAPHLPKEIVVKILELVLPQDETIEFSPIEVDTKQNNFSTTLGVFQYERVLDYQNKIRPLLSLLRVNKAFTEEGARLYYSNNTFRFSSGLGWLVFARFIDLIGSKNTALLRNIQIVHPLLSDSQYFRTHEQVAHFYLHRLSPFGMADLAGYDDIYVADDTHGLTTAADMRKILRDITALRHLDLLFYCKEPSTRTWAHFVGASYIFEFKAAALQFPHDTLYDAKAQPKLRVRLVHLYQPQDRTDFEMPSQYPNFPRLSAFGLPYRLRRHPEWPAEHFPAAKALFLHLTDMGIEVQDMRVHHSTGIWPLGDFDNDPTWVETRVGHTQPKYVEDGATFFARSCFELIYFDRGLPESMRPRPLHPDMRTLTSSYHPDRFFACVECWRSRYSYDTWAREVCQHEQKKIVPEGWKVGGLVIGNPGVPITVHTDQPEGENVTWKKSHAVRVFEEGRKEGREKVFGFGSFGDGVAEVVQRARAVEPAPIRGITEWADRAVESYWDLDMTRETMASTRRRQPE